MTEKHLQNAILRLGTRRACAWANVGVARGPACGPFRYTRTGGPPASCRTRRPEIEVKTATGRQTAEQRV